jgi:hypothetical protein
MVRSTITPLLIVAGIALCTTEASADLYSMVDYPNFQNGYSVGGTITATTLGGISAWDITISQGTDILFTFTQNNSQFQGTTPTITPTLIYMPTGFSGQLSETPTVTSNRIVWDSTDPTFGTEYMGELSAVGLWDNFQKELQNFTIATVETVSVPEPSSCLLAVCGVVSGIAYAEVRKRRAKRRRDGGGQS